MLPSQKHSGHKLLQLVNFVAAYKLSALIRGFARVKSRIKCITQCLQSRPYAEISVCEVNDGYRSSSALI